MIRSFWSWLYGWNLWNLYLMFRKKTSEISAQDETFTLQLQSSKLPVLGNKLWVNILISQVTGSLFNQQMLQTVTKLQQSQNFILFGLSPRFLCRRQFLPNGAVLLNVPQHGDRRDHGPGGRTSQTGFSKGGGVRVVTQRRHPLRGGCDKEK